MEILLIQWVDTLAVGAVCLKGFEDRRGLPCAVPATSTERPAQAEGGSVFDNRLNVPVASERCSGSRSSETRNFLTPSSRMGFHQVSNESLILAQNQRWRRA